MKLLDQLSKQLNQAQFYVDEKERQVQAWVQFRERLYMGCATCHPSDAEFFSPRVGKHIALGRAYLNALSDLLEATRAEYLSKKVYHDEVTAFGEKNPAEVDPTGAFTRNLERAAARYQAVQTKYKDVKTHLASYLKGLERSHNIVRKFRERLDEIN